MSDGFKRCVYVYPESHKRAGERCKSLYVVPNTGGLCKSHAVQLGRLKLVHDVGDKISRGMDAAKLKKDTLDTIKEKGLMPGDLDPDGIERATVEQLYHDIVGDLGVDIGEMVKEIEAQDGISFRTINTSIDFHVQALFVMWWMADPHTRKPKSFTELSKILGRSVYVLRGFLDEKWFYEKLAKSRMDRMKLLGPYIDRKNAIKALDGDRTATSLFYKNQGKLEPDDGPRELNEMDDITDELLQEGIEIANADEHDIRLKYEEHEIHRNLLEADKIDD